MSEGTPPPEAPLEREVDADGAALLERVREALYRPRRATYRLQLGPSLTFEGVAQLAPYLDALGISEVYLSPCFRAAPGSSHGYDVVDHSSFNPEIGSVATFEAMAQSLAERGLGVVLDIVPNHMGIAGDANPWWLDVLETGPASRYAGFFDINWTGLRPALRNTLLLPVLSDQYGTALEAGTLTLEFAEGGFFVRYAGARLPLAPHSYARVLRHRIEALRERLGEDHPGFHDLMSILTAIDHLPARTETDPARREELAREKEVVKRRLAGLVKEFENLQVFVEDNVTAFNGTPGDPASFDLLDALLGEQAYRLADWRVAGDEVNYRRFFDVNHLAAIRMEVPQVFEATHRLVSRLVGAGLVTGLRVDHPDGLYGPGEYFRRLQEEAVVHVARRLAPDLDSAQAEALLTRHRAAAADPAGPGARPLWVLAEKILLAEEALPDWWLVAGTTGYDFLVSVNGLFVDRGASRQMTAIYHRFVGERSAMADLAYEARRLIMQTTMAGETNQLGHRLTALADRNRRSRDFTLPILVRAIRETIACFPVYRTYVRDEAGEVSARDGAYIARAIAEAQRRNPQMSSSVFDFLRDLLVLRVPGPADDPTEWRDFVARFQQATGPVMAKGVEDTAFYRYHRLVSLNEVGGDPARFGEAVAAFHGRNATRQGRWPGSLLATSTHDTKRGEDVRARIDVLSEIPAEWHARVRRWRRLARRFKRPVAGALAPARNEEYLLYQTLVGAWPVQEWDEARLRFTDRIQAYMEKAVKEAKTHTGWINPDPDYDAAVREFVAGILAADSALVADLRPFQALLARHGMLNSLAQTVLKIASAGIPDFYQGTEGWDLALVDPDNRRPVNFDAARARLDTLAAEIEATADRPALCARLLEEWRDGRVKLFTIVRGLGLRRADPGLFVEGDYLPLTPRGRQADHLLAFARRSAGRAVIAVVPRLTVRLTGFSGELPLGEAVWADTWVGLDDPRLDGTWVDHFTGEHVDTESVDGRPALRASRLFAHFPVALLERARGAA
jgi:(1->4)-alpha-D-glucan 1-alpha-D-glucosylmutase